MTDEKLAEEYYYKIYPVTLDIGEEERKEKVMNIFLAGLKVGKEKSKKEIEEELLKCYQGYEEEKL